MSKDTRKEIISWIVLLVMALGLALVINRFVIFKVSPLTDSMENTIMIDDKVVTLRIAYLFGGPKRGDIVAFKNPDDETQDYIKRVIGLPGDTVEVKDGVVYINGESIEEDYTKETPEGDYGPYNVPEGRYFMMGDNRNTSWDSRFWSNKFVAKNKIYGKGLFKYPDFKWLN